MRLILAYKSNAPMQFAFAYVYGLTKWPKALII